MRRPFYLLSGLTAFAVGTVGIFLPLLPTVPFYILAAFCFGRSHPAWEARLLADPRFGPHVRAWRAKGAISPHAKRLALGMLSLSAAVGLFALPFPWSLMPLAVAVVTGSWIWRRPDR